MEFRFILSIGNDAMQSGVDLAGALRRAAMYFDNVGDLEPMHAESVRDFNGNRVGQFKITDETER